MYLYGKKKKSSFTTANQNKNHQPTSYIFITILLLGSVFIFLHFIFFSIPNQPLFFKFTKVLISFSTILLLFFFFFFRKILIPFASFFFSAFFSYGLDHAHYFSSPGLTWQTAFKKTKIQLELLTIIDMLLMIEKGIRGGICHAIHGYAEANNNCVKDDKNKESSYLKYLDINS